MTSPFVNPDDWFENAFPSGDGFAEWLEGSGFFGDEPPLQDLGTLLRNDPALFWSYLPDHVKEHIQATYVQALLRGHTPSPPRRAPAADETPDTLSTAGSGPAEAEEELPGLEREYEEADEPEEPAKPSAADSIDLDAEYIVPETDLTAAEYFSAVRPPAPTADDDEFDLFRMIVERLDDIQRSWEAAGESSPPGATPAAPPPTPPADAVLKPVRTKFDEATPAAASAGLQGCFGLPRNIAIVLAVVAAAAVAIALFAVGGGGDGDEAPAGGDASATSTAGQPTASPVSGGSGGNDTGGDDNEGSVAVFVADDDLDDIGPQASDLTAIEDPNLAGDITRVSAEVDADANEMQLMIWFAGDAQALQASTGAELGAGVLVKPADGSRGLDLIYKTDGSKKGSDPPAGFSLDVSWYRSDVLLFEIGGYAPPSGSVIEFQTFQTENFAFSSDRATLTVDAAGADFLRYHGEFGGLQVE